MNGRPRKEIVFEELERLCELQCTQAEIANWFGVSEDTICRRIKETFSLTFAEFFAQNRSGGKISLRRTQWKLAEKNASMAIWLGKQYLKQGEAPREVVVEKKPNEDLAKLTTDQLERMKAIYDE